MTEAEWLATTDCFLIMRPFWPKLNNRKCRLHEAAVLRRFDTLFPGLGYRTAAEVTEKYADRKASKAEYEAAQVQQYDEANRCYFAAWTVTENAIQGSFFRDIFGNPFRPVTLDSTWHTAIVKARAEAAYEDRILPVGTLQAVRLAILADALVEAGCDNAVILDHLRSPGPHVLGCWTVDLILEKK